MDRRLHRCIRMNAGAQTATAPVVAPFTRWGRWFWPVALAVLVLDQVSKWWLFSLPSSQLPSWLSCIQNRGVAWSMGERFPNAVALLTVVLIPVLIGVWWKWFRPLGSWENLAFGAILGGAIGNGFDRVCARFGWFDLTGVRDFIHVDLGFWPLDPWPTFNIADAGITCGFLVLVVLSFAKPHAAAQPVAPAVTGH